jgi:2-oxoglutarate ferredoxin oxidoreductase subunit alpha
MGTKEKDRAKNMFVLGFLYWMYNRSMDNTISFLKEKFSIIISLFTIKFGSN